MASARKRIGAALAALALAFAAMLCFANPAWADEPNYGKTVYVNGVSNGDTATAYKLIGYGRSNYNEFVYDDVSSFGEYVTDKKGSDMEEGVTIDQYLSKLQPSEMRDLLNGYMNNWDTYGKPNTTVSGKAENGNDATPNLADPGYYLIAASTEAENSRIYLPTSVFIKVDGNSSKLYTGNNNEESNAATAAIMLKSDKAPTIEKRPSTQMDHGMKPKQ